MIETRNLTKRFGARTAVEDLSFRVDAGEIVGLLGPNGAGKTTSLRLIAGMIGPSSGRAMIRGVDLAIDPAGAHEAIGLLTESAGFYERMTAEQNLRYFARFYNGVEARGAAQRALQGVGLTDRARDRVGTFSKGMKQRLALARCLLHEPPVLLLDEPTGGLDPEVAKELRSLIARFRSEGRSILLSTHNLSEAEGLADRIAILKTRLLALDTPSALRRSGERVHIRIEAPEWPHDAVEAVRSEGFVRNVTEPSNGVVRFVLEDPEEDRSRLVARLVQQGVEILSVSAEGRTLEDVYLDLVREEAP